MFFFCFALTVILTLLLISDKEFLGTSPNFFTFPAAVALLFISEAVFCSTAPNWFTFLVGDVLHESDSLLLGIE